MNLGMGQSTFKVCVNVIFKLVCVFSRVEYEVPVFLLAGECLLGDRD